MGGGNALTTSLRPDLRSATVQSTNAVDDTTTVRVCFSKAIASLPQAALFHLGAYADFNLGATKSATSATRSTSNCADAVFPTSDATQHTFVTVEGSQGTAPDSGTSAVSSNGFGNIEDSTALIGSKTNNGTRGFNTNPDLVGITVNNAAATIDFTYDQRVAFAGPLANDFVANLPNGDPVPSLAGAGNRTISADGLTVRVNFAAGSLNTVVRAYSASNAVIPKTVSYVAGGPLRSAARPGNGGFTDRPDLVAVTPAADGSSIDYQFDQVVTVLGPAASFLVQVSNFTDFAAGGAPVVVGGLGVGNTVRVPCTSFGGCFRYNERIIGGATLAGAVTGAGGTSTAGGVPAGGNAGAFATGFVAGPDALSVTFDNATDIVRVLFDQRWFADNDAQFKLIDDQGSQIGAAAINVSGGGSPTAGKTTAEITFPAGSVAGARSLLIRENAVEAGGATLPNMRQVISPTAPAARTARKFRKAKTITSKQRAAIRRAAKRVR